MKFNEVKQELKKRRENVKYFNKAFFNTYIDAIRLRKYNLEHDVNDDYVMDGIRLVHCFDPVYNTDFYNKNSACYCEFLSIVYGAELVKG